MTQTTISNGTRQVVITEQTEACKSRFSARLYVNAGGVNGMGTATLQAWKGETLSGAKRWAARILGM